MSTAYHLGQSYTRTLRERAVGEELESLARLEDFAGTIDDVRAVRSMCVRMPDWHLSGELVHWADYEIVRAAQ